ncbi:MULTISPECIES: ATP-binding protein [unclassified Bradyrhizobium]|uniref:ATP-binding protein n=1 Tax=unclassified Bradyrhizobium TaxID=2631580 RepID=UPI002479A94A|nr:MULTISPECIES: ATP-binding protein [unclassified Bradyrhizobium]WGR73782.1 ATP-binding protein [Bradyrhizobium sp. ISRA426]WGR78620.1 ATP-binding protein [Bradyrhizobium sp. ISRA430]WGR89021.1 ATP-binding protein [Bradyrhizobium sp. ISRA432]
MTASLRGRLFVGLTAIILLTGAVGGILAYRWAFGEAIEMQDSLLIQMGGLLQNRILDGGRALPGVDDDAEVWVMELGKTPRGTPQERKYWSFQDGLHDAMRNGQPIRLLLQTRADGTRLAVAQSTGFRHEIAGDMAFRTFLPIGALIPCLMVVVAIVIDRSLRPMARVASELDGRSADDTTSLQLDHVPSELHPFIGSINGLFQRMRLMMEQQRRFIADAAHELRTPIAALSVQAENLESIELPQSARDRAAAINQGMARTKHLLEQLLALARHDAYAVVSEREPIIALDRAAKDVVADMLPEALTRGIDLGFELVESVWVRSEQVMLTSLIRNLIDNAIRFTPKGGRVDVGIYRQGGRAILQIEDSGPGVAPENIERIFEPFFRGSHPQGEGSGLGLSIVRRAVHCLGGSIVLENIVEKGQTGLRVTVELPLCEATSTESKADSYRARGDDLNVLR